MAKKSKLRLPLLQTRKRNYYVRLEWSEDPVDSHTDWINVTFGRSTSTTNTRQLQALRMEGDSDTNLDGAEAGTAYLAWIVEAFDVDNPSPGSDEVDFESQPSWQLGVRNLVRGTKITAWSTDWVNFATEDLSTAFGESLASEGELESHSNSETESFKKSHAGFPMNRKWLCLTHAYITTTWQ